MADDPERTPTWVKAVGAVVLAVVIALAVLFAVRGVDGHGPGRHFAPAGAHGR